MLPSPIHFFALLLTLPFAVLSSPVPWQANQDASHYDVLIVGGGPAGLSALSGLARVRRKALLIDSGEYRNLLTRHAHDIIGSDGTQPSPLWNPSLPLHAIGTWNADEVSQV